MRVHAAFSRLHHAEREDAQGSGFLRTTPRILLKAIWAKGPLAEDAEHAENLQEQEGGAQKQNLVRLSAPALTPVLSTNQTLSYCFSVSVPATITD